MIISLPPKPARVSPLYVARLSACVLVNTFLVALSGALVFTLGCLIMFDNVQWLP